MSRNRSFRRKIIYLIAIGLLLPVLYWLGHPEAQSTKDAKGSPGGKLAQIRREQKLSLTQLGQIDPTSETIKLATFGMRPIAANLLWAKANDYKMKKDWTNLSATLNQLTKVQPNIIEFWRFQGWNLAYNCSTEFDDYRQRYRWVIKGIEFIKLGQNYNDREPRLLSNIGWIISQKIGRADEHKQFRKMFRADDDYHGARPKDERDNWLVGKRWYKKAEVMVDTMDVPITGDSPLIFRSKRPMCQMN
ncbi:MAG: IRE (iron responsive element), partial [Planctomycetota bacterium]|nr:IRE (iron responsive element) [Planctomycetota bacterium]